MLIQRVIRMEDMAASTARTASTIRTEIMEASTAISLRIIHTLHSNRALSTANKSTKGVEQMRHILIASLFIGTVALGFKVTLDYLALPIVAFNQGGQCVYIEREGVRNSPCSCIPDKYIRENVAGWSNKGEE